MRHITLEGVSGSVTEMCRRYGAPYGRVSKRLTLGWSEEEAFGLVERRAKQAPPKPKQCAGLSFSQRRHNLIAAIAGELSGEEYLRREGLPPPLPGHELPDYVEDVTSEAPEKTESAHPRRWLVEAGRSTVAPWSAPPQSDAVPTHPCSAPAPHSES